MKGITAFSLMSEIDLDIIEESMALVGESKAVVGGRVKEESALSRFLNSGWGVAMICAVVSLAVLIAMIQAGRNAPVKPPVVGTAESGGVTEPEGEPDTEQETKGGADTEDTTESDTESVTEGVLHPDVTEGGVLFVSNGDGTCKIKGADKAWEGTIVVPERSPYGDVVTTVATAAFKGFRSITSVTLPDTVTVIGNSAFQGCVALRSVDLPPAVTEFGKAMFDGCGELQEVVLPAGLTEIPAMTFQTCVSLRRVVAQDGITHIGANAFNGSRSMAELTLSAGLESIGASAFMNCCGLQTVYYGGTRDEWSRVEVNPQNNAYIEWVDVVYGG